MSVLLTWPYTTDMNITGAKRVTKTIVKVIVSNCMVQDVYTNDDNIYVEVLDLDINPNLDIEHATEGLVAISV